MSDDFLTEDVIRVLSPEPQTVQDVRRAISDYKMRRRKGKRITLIDRSPPYKQVADILDGLVRSGVVTRTRPHRGPETFSLFIPPEPRCPVVPE